MIGSSSEAESDSAGDFSGSEEEEQEIHEGEWSGGSDEEEERETGTESEGESQPLKKKALEQLPPSSEWIAFNNKVISMRPLFKSAKIQFINNTTRQIKRYRTKKGTPEQILKNTNKADRLVQEMLYINRLKKDVIAKFALLHSKEEIAKIICSSNTTMEYRVKAKVASMGRIAKVAQEYHQAHPEWRTSLFKLIQVAGKTMKNKRRKLRGAKKKRKKIEPTEPIKGSKKVQQKVVNVDKEADGSERFDVSNFPNAPSSDEDVDNSNDESDTEECDRAVKLGLTDKPKQKLVGNVPQKSGGQSVNVPTPLNKTVRQSTKNQKPPKRAELKVSDHDTEETQDNSDDSGASSTAEFSDTEPNKKMSKSNKIPADNRQQRKSNIDPFFLTSDNQEYRSQFRVEPADSEKPTKKRQNNKHNEMIFKNATPFKELMKRAKSGIKGGPAPKISRVDKRDTKKKATHGKDKTLPTAESLHPSWQAKKKLSVSAVPFEGKKIVFDED